MVLAAAMLGPATVLVNALLSAATWWLGPDVALSWRQALQFGWTGGLALLARDIALNRRRRRSDPSMSRPPP
jgi:hypothetical protein